MSLDELARSASTALTEATTNRTNTGVGRTALRRTVHRRRRTRIAAVAVLLVALAGTLGTRLGTRTVLPYPVDPTPTPNAVHPTPIPVVPTPTPVIPHPAAIIVRGAQGLVAVDPETGARLKLLRRDPSPYEYSGDALGTSADGTQVAYELGAGFSGVVIADLWRPAPRVPVVIAVSPGRQATARWSPNGIIVARFAFGKSELVTSTIQNAHLTAEHTQPVALAADPGANILVSWSADGSQLAFSAGGPRSTRSLYVMNADGSNLRMRRSGAGNLQRRRSGVVTRRNRIAYVSHNSLVVINPDGTGRRVVGTVGDSVEDKYVGTGIAWSPDSTSIAFLGKNVKRSGWALYVMKLNGTTRLVPVASVSGFTLAWAAGS